MDFQDIQGIVFVMTITSGLGLVVAFLAGGLSGKLRFVSPAFILILIMVSASRIIAFGGPSGEARLIIEDGSYVVMSAVATREANGAVYYNLFLTQDKMEEARYYKISSDVLEVDNASTDRNLRALTVVSKQGLRKATLHYPLIGG